ncbi:SDR family NAD(P)-dependent oxidoreductase [Actinoallomurus sp. CA-150999]|uniref:SDR family NAD(P)-dependent oxidoreductase n=1 Tax=Actinoallomurus sp. CA-150999 TaxID=3239887 RepID=UPI003D8BEFB4
MSQAIGNGRAVFITGATGGIGTATTRALAERGYRVYAGVRGDAPHLAEIRGVEQIHIDVTEPKSVAEATAEVTRLQGGRGLHAVVNNAGIIIQGPLELVPAEDLRRQFAVNVFGPAEVIRAFAPLLREGRGRLINISAPTARLAMPFAAPISASKAALDALSDALRIELGAQGVAVVTVVPGAVETPIFAKAEAAAMEALADADPARLALYRSRIEAMGAAMAKMRQSKPETVADTIVKAVGATRPKARYLANSDVRPALLVSRLPVRLRDRVVVGLLGLRKAEAAGPALGS